MRIGFVGWGSLFLFAGPWLSACGAGSKGADAQAPSGTPAGARNEGEKGAFDLNALLAREASGLSPADVQAEFVRAKVLVKSKPEVSVDKTLATLKFPIGTEAPVTCIAFRQDVDPGAFLFQVLDRTKKLGELKEIRILPVSVIKESPVLALSALYVVKRPEGNAVGELKIQQHSRLNHSSLCFHDELGYRNTFSSVARSYFESENRAGEERASQFVEIQVGHINGTPAGYDKVEIFRDPNGNLKVLSLGLILALRSPTDLMAFDYVSVTTVDAQGIVLDGRFVQSENGRPKLDLTMTRKQGSSYDYSGSSHGKPISGQFKTKGKQGLESGMEADKRVAKSVRGSAAFSFEVETYQPGSDPTKTKMVQYRRDKTDPPRLIKVKEDDTEMAGTVDEFGRMTEAESKIGPITIKLKREFVRGSP